MEAGMQVVYRGRHAAVLVKRLHIRDSERQHDADNQHYRQELIERKACLGSVLHATYYKESLRRLSEQPISGTSIPTNGQKSALCFDLIRT